MVPVKNASTGARARVRAELVTEIKDVARRHLAVEGPDGLSLRAVARDLGLVSSALYRYFPSRDVLLTAIIVDAYNSLGAAVEAAESATKRRDSMSRWLALAKGTRLWAVEHPSQWALVFGSPVPGYQAPDDTIDPAARIPMLMLAIAGDALPGSDRSLIRKSPMSKVIHADLAALRTSTGSTLSDAGLAQAVAAWTALVGLVSFELFGHLTNVITDHEAFFTHQMRAVGSNLGLDRR